MVRLLARLFRASALLRGAAVLSMAHVLLACVADPRGARQPIALNQAVPSQPVPLPAGGPKVAILLPLSGPNAPIGQAMLNAIHLSLDGPGAPPIEQHDTAAEGAANAVQAALLGGAQLILGPLTGPDTAAAGPLARAAGVPVLAFTSDETRGGPGVWALGITPAQQVRRLLQALPPQSRVAAVVPGNPFGDAITAGMLQAATPPRVVRARPGFSGMKDAIREVSEYGSRHGAQPEKPPPMDALFLGVIGDMLGQAAPLLEFYEIPPGQVRVLGPATWARDALHLPKLSGAWFAAADPAARTAFEQAYTAKFSAPARDFTSLAYDAAGIALAVRTADGFPAAALTRPEGFAGADGLVALRADGAVRRGLVVFEVDMDGAHVVQPAPPSVVEPAT